MDIILLGITIVSLVVALVMSVAAWRVTRDEKKRSAARVAALSLASAGGTFDDRPKGLSLQSSTLQESDVKQAVRAPWSAPPSTPRPSPAPFDSAPSAPAKVASLRTT